MEEGKAPGLSWKRVEDTLSVAPPFPRRLPGSGGNTSGRSTNGRLVQAPRAVCAVSRWTSRRPRDYPSTMDTTRITPKPKIGRASWRERVEIAGHAGTVK